MRKMGDGVLVYIRLDGCLTTKGIYLDKKEVFILH